MTETSTTPAPVRQPGRPLHIAAIIVAALAVAAAFALLAAPASNAFGSCGSVLDSYSSSLSCGSALDARQSLALTVGGVGLAAAALISFGGVVMNDRALRPTTAA